MDSNSYRIIKEIQKNKDNIKRMIEERKYDDAILALEQYEKVMPEDIDIYSMRAVIMIMNKRLDIAEVEVLKGLERRPNDFDLLFNLGYINEVKGQSNKAYTNYLKAGTLANNLDQSNDISSALVRLNEKILRTQKERLVFFVKPGMDSFLDSVINELKQDFHTRKIIVTSDKQIEEGLKWCDVAWFEWCDDLITYGSNHPIANKKKIICRLHSYEAFTDYIHQVNWTNIYKVIFVAEHIRKYVLSQQKLLKIESTIVIPNGVDIDFHTFKERRTGFRIAYVGYINYKKGPMILLHSFKAIHDFDNRYKLYIAGKFQDPRYVLYFNQMIEEFGLQGSVIYEGWQENVEVWLEDKNYILSTSLLESQSMSLMEAMIKGIKPLIHNFVGAREIYPSSYIWNTFDDLVQIVKSQSYNSFEYRNYIVNNFNLKHRILQIKCLLLT
ncbi:glycosyltransferase [Paenibacillus sp. GCM10023248]|uniref:glycosyltransferase n=1 Tax=unclassified Paenibacillus TaxID=185978 RepID=UPI0023784B95|nr:glycosyltransferase [Paenibacillus sp. MAHUQ-63]MDD9271806.1 glycosyltransferase [Paenibacillus sp. MAHUQ-63]